MRKKVRSPHLFRRKQSFIDLANSSSKETVLVRTVRALVRALMTNYAQYVMRNAILRNHLKKQVSDYNHENTIFHPGQCSLKNLIQGKRS